MKKPFVIFGATSGIAESFAHELAKKKKCPIVLVGRDQLKLELIAMDLKNRHGIDATVEILNFLDYVTHKNFVQKIWDRSGGLSGVLLAQGQLGNQIAMEKDFNEVKSLFEINVLSILSILTPLANLFERQKSGWIVVITSVAGVRGRASLSVYGATKAALSTFVSGLRVRLTGSNVKVIDIRPGPIETAMTSHLKKGPLFASPTKIAPMIYSAMIADKAVAYVPGFWFLIMTIIRLLPDFVFKKLKNL
jgi:decaprenylphospho-beta-D-erythro-pentofuranosid-2-ulose 2-reductase